MKAGVALAVAALCSSWCCCFRLLPGGEEESPPAAEPTLVPVPPAVTPIPTTPATTVAWLLNGDAHPHHIGNIANAVNALLRIGVPPTQIFVASEEPWPARSVPAQNLAIANTQGLARERALLGERLAPGGTLLVYLTGHGAPGDRGNPMNTWVALHRSHPYYAEELLRSIGGLPFGRLIVASDTCHGGGFVHTLVRRPGSYTGMSATDAYHTTFCQPFAPLLWSQLLALDPAGLAGAYRTAVAGCDQFRRTGRCVHTTGCPSYAERAQLVQREGAYGQPPVEGPKGGRSAPR